MAKNYKEFFMKRIVCILLLAVCLTAGLSAQSKMALGLDTMPLFKGFIWADGDAKNSLFALSPSFEYLIAPHYSIGGTVDLWFGKAANIDILYFGLTFQGRWYPLSTSPEKLFLGAGLGFKRFTVDGKTDLGGFLGLTAALKAGYKLTIGKFFMEPSMAYVYSKIGAASTPTPLGWQAGLNLGLIF
jgi:hypothetical protein